MQGNSRLTEKISELETRIQTLVEDSKNVRALDTALDVTSLASHVHCSVRVRVSRGTKHRILIKTLNRFSPLSDTPTEKLDKSALVIGDSLAVCF